MEVAGSGYPPTMGPHGTTAISASIASGSWELSLSAGCGTSRLRLKSSLEFELLASAPLGFMANLARNLHVSQFPVPLWKAWGIPFEPTLAKDAEISAFHLSISKNVHVHKNAISI